MNEDHAKNYESDPRFPSGPWEGLWDHGCVAVRMRLSLDFFDEEIQGYGDDSLGGFMVSGSYRTEDGVVTLCKQYYSGLDVMHHGLAGGHLIQGEWHIQQADEDEGGDWQIWPIEDDYELVHLEIDTADGPLVIIGKPTESKG